MDYEQRMASLDLRIRNLEDSLLEIEDALKDREPLTEGLVLNTLIKGLETVKIHVKA